MYRVIGEVPIDLASEGVPDQATEVIVYVKISISSSGEAERLSIQGNFFSAMLDLGNDVLGNDVVELIVSTNSPNGVIERKVYIGGRNEVRSCNSHNISLPVACNGDRIVRIFFKDQYRSFAVPSVQIVGYYRK